MAVGRGRGLNRNGVERHGQERDATCPAGGPPEGGIKGAKVAKGRGEDVDFNRLELSILRIGYLENGGLENAFGMLDTLLAATLTTEEFAAPL